MRRSVQRGAWHLEGAARPLLFRDLPTDARARRRESCRLFRALVATVLLASLAAGCRTLEAPRSDRPVDLVHDDGAHEEAPTEAWYWNAHVETKDGRRFHLFYGFDTHYLGEDWFGIWPVTLSVANPEKASMMAFIGIADEHRRRYETDYKTNTWWWFGWHASAGTLHLGARDWRAEQEGRGWRVRCSTSSYEADLHFKPVKPAMLHGSDAGIIRIPPTGSTYYYSYPRTEVTGTIQTDSKSESVAGTGWFEHEWGYFYNQRIYGWQWFSIQWTDGTEVMISLLRGSSGDADLASFATVSAKDGLVTRYTGKDLRARASWSWQSPSSDKVYPVSWSLAIPKAGLEIETTPVLLDQEANQPFGRFWEGAVRARGKRNGVSLEGVGFTELIDLPWNWFTRLYKASG